MAIYTPIDLTPHFNAVGATYDTDRTAGAVNSWGNSFPAEELPFGSTITLANIPFDLPPKKAPDDHLQAMAQEIRLQEPLLATGLALLCLGEMGDQEVDINLHGKNRAEQHLTAIGESWLVEGTASNMESCYICSHLHYAGGYELMLLRPALWCWQARWHRPIWITRISFGLNPLFHLFAATCLNDGY